MCVERGARVGGYEILSGIGAGAMGEVYRARPSTLQRDVALKLLPEAAPWTGSALRRLLPPNIS
jgi:serine/threonine protein kinase